MLKLAFIDDAGKEPKIGVDDWNKGEELNTSINMFNLG